MSRDVYPQGPMGSINILESVSERDRRVLAIRFLRSDETMGSLLLRCRGDSAASADSRVELACMLLMAKQDAPEDLRMTDPQPYKRLRDRVTELRMAGWLSKSG